MYEFMSDYSLGHQSSDHSCINAMFTVIFFSNMDLSNVSNYDELKPISPFSLGLLYSYSLQFILHLNYNSPVIIDSTQQS